MPLPRLLPCVCVLFALAHGRAQAPPAAFEHPAGQAKAVGSPTRSDSIDLLHTRIDLDLRQTAGGIIAAHAAMTFVPKVSGIGMLPVDLQLTVDSVRLDGTPLAFADVGEEVRIALGAIHGPEDTLTVNLFYHGDPVTDPSGFGGFYTLSNYQYDLGVAFDAVPHSFGRSWFPCFDNFVERCTFDLFVRTDDAHTVLGNGRLVSITEPLPGERITHWNLAEPIPSYLASVAAGAYEVLRDTFPSSDGRLVPVTLAALPADTADMRSSFVHLQDAFDTFESWFGPYRWERVGYVLTSAGAMEHATNICYPDFSADGSLTDERLMAHELSHHWFGDLITCQRAEEMYINEGFADLCGFLFIEGLYGPEAYRTLVRGNHHDMVAKVQLLDHGWYALNDVPQSHTYGDHSYKKGADVLRTLRAYLGDDRFGTGLTRVLANNAFSDMGSLELRDSLEAATGAELDDFFADWILQPGWAAFEVDSFHVAPAGSAFAVQAYLEQKTRGPAALYHHVPATLTCLGSAGEVHRAVMDLDGALPVVTVECPFAPVALRLNDDERLALATTAEERTIPDTGPETFALADFRFVVTALPEPFPLRVEEFWVAADDHASPDLFVVSPDRWWRVEGTVPAGTALGGQLTLDGRTTSSNAFDIGLMQNAGAVTFREDSLVLLYRPNAHFPWTPHPTFTVNTLGNATDRSARVDFTGLVPGDYCMGWRSSATPVGETNPTLDRWTCTPTVTRDAITVRHTGHPPGRGNILRIRDASGRLVMQRPITGDRLDVDLTDLAPQSLFPSIATPDGAEIPLGTVVLIR